MFDIFSRAGRLVKDAATTRVLGGLAPQRVLAMGELQSACCLTAHSAKVAPLAKAYDGFLIRTRFGAAAPRDNTSMLAAMLAAQVGTAKGALMPVELPVPALTVIAESDLLGWPPLNGYRVARQPDTDRLRVCGKSPGRPMRTTTSSASGPSIRVRCRWRSWRQLTRPLRAPLDGSWMSR